MIRDLRKQIICEESELKFQYISGELYDGTIILFDDTIMDINTSSAYLSNSRTKELIKKNIIAFKKLGIREVKKVVYYMGDLEYIRQQFIDGGITIINLTENI